MKELRKNKLINLFCELAQIPSPSLKEEQVAKKIIEIFEENGIKAKRDEYGNVKAEIEATDKTKKPILLSSHMDVVGDNSPVNIKLNGDILETDKTRTLGADDKAGVAAAMMLAIDINNDKNLLHGGLEIIFTRDEEHNMSGIHNVKTEEINSEYVMVLDADRLGQVQISGADYTNLTVYVTGLKGGHSGIDIDDKTRVNAAKLIAEVVSEIPQGVYKKDNYGVVTSINLGVIAGGGVDTALNELKENPDTTGNYIEYIAERAVTNVINTKATAVYSIRSSDKKSENELIAEVGEIVKKFNKKYSGIATVEMKTEEHLPAFEKSDDETIIKVAKEAGRNINLNVEISSFHAGAETHIYANSKNKAGKVFKPVLIGVADIYNMHSNDEKLDYKSFIKGYEFLKEMFKVFNKN